MKSQLCQFRLIRSADRVFLFLLMLLLIVLFQFQKNFRWFLAKSKRLTILLGLLGKVLFLRLGLRVKQRKFFLLLAVQLSIRQKNFFEYYDVRKILQFLNFLKSFFFALQILLADQEFLLL